MIQQIQKRQRRLSFRLTAGWVVINFFANLTILPGVSYAQRILPTALNLGTAASEAPGGIDLTPDPDAFDLEIEGKGTPLDIPFDPSMPDQIPYGLTPVIIQIIPITNANLPLLLGFDTKPSDELAQSSTMM